jgi:hypothetical protein
VPLEGDSEPPGVTVGLTTVPVLVGPEPELEPLPVPAFEPEPAAGPDADPEFEPDDGPLPLSVPDATCGGGGG